MSSLGSGQFTEAGMSIVGWRIHRRIGMSGGLFTRMVARELGRSLNAAEAEQLKQSVTTSRDGVTE